jgi:hypothetical protein
MFHKHLVVACVLAVLASLALVTTSLAFDQTTRWYSIRVSPASDASPPLFLTNGSDGVTLERYRSGDPTQMWAITNEDYPTAAAVTGGGGLGGGSNVSCLAEAGWGCEFRADAGDVIRLVNRASGGCLMFGRNAGAVTAPCLHADNGGERQKWQVPHNIDAGLYAPLRGLTQGRTRCLSAADRNDGATSSATVASNCSSASYEWFELFLGQRSATFTCTTDWAYNLCFVQE